MPETAATPFPVYIAHATDGRARLRAIGKPSQDAWHAALDALAVVPGITRTLARPNTGSLIIEADLTEDALRNLLATSDCLKLKQKPPVPPLGMALQLGVLQTDEQVRKRTFGQLNLHTALGAILLVAAVVQLGRGRVFGPTATLLVNALALLETGSRPR